MFGKKAAEVSIITAFDLCALSRVPRLTVSDSWTREFEGAMASDR
jgi:hypothetical protein